MLGNILEQLRIEKGLTQTELADNLGISRVNYNRYEKNERTPDNQTLIKIAEYYSVSTDYLLGRVDRKNATVELDKILKDAARSSVIAAHSQDLSDEEQDELINYIKYMKSKRKMK